MPGVRETVTGWADIAEAYRPVVGQAQRWSPDVSVGVIANEAGSPLRATINSILAQSISEIEIVIVGAAAELVHTGIGTAAAPRIRRVQTAAAVSVAAGFNVVLDNSRGRFIKLLGAGATLHPDCIAAQLRVLKSDRGIALVAAGTRDAQHGIARPEHRCGSRRIVGVRSGQCTVRTIVRSGCDPIGPVAGVMFRRAAFERCRDLRKQEAEWQALDLWTRLLRFGDFVGMPDTLVTETHTCEAFHRRAAMRDRLANRIRIARRLTDDPVWEVSTGDRLVGEVNCFWSSLQGRFSALRKHPRRRRDDIVEYRSCVS
ncbi:hypothetical protein BHQ18_12305 [Mycolicibacterium flavescens]|uniref:Uncharacterized protein n=2 Tax=Mycolicibacterium flavescens TaxID=1776 RepID=A0A1E3RK03_MYCFV|nr:hypothetical protein BHQ18_12305 [Mycolicibacterium flavescens]